MRQILPTSSIPSHNDAEIWQNLKNSSELAFSLIFSKYYPDMYSYGLKIANDQELVKDTIQDLLVTLWTTKEKLGDLTTIKFYLLKSLRRSLIKNLERQKKSLFHLYLFKSFEPDLAFSPEETIILEETNAEKDAYFSTLLNSLPKRQKEAIFLKYYAELEFEEVAEIMGLNYQSVVNHIHRAFKVLRKNKAFTEQYHSQEGLGT